MAPKVMVDAEVGLEAVEDDRRDLERIGRLCRRPPGRQNTERHLASADGPPVDDVERADGERHEVGRQWRRRGERDGLLVAVDRLRHGRSVGHRHEVFRNRQGELPGHLERRLVERRKCTPRIGRLELAEDVPVVAFLLTEQTVRVGVVDDSLVGELERAGAGRDRFLGAQADELVTTGDHLEVDRAVAEARPRRPDLEPLRVQPDQSGRRLYRDVDRDVAGEGLIGRVDLQVSAVCRRRHIAGQSERGGLFDACRGGGDQDGERGRRDEPLHLESPLPPLAAPWRTGLCARADDTTLPGRARNRA